MKLRILVAALALAVVLPLAGCTTDAPAASPNQPDTQAQAPADEPAADAPSGSDPVLVDAPADGGPAIAIGADAMDPSTLTIKAGDVVTFTSGDDSFHGLVINSLASVTVAKGLPEYYRFDDAGSYAVSDELTSATATITVQ
jgi:plastocyanin